MLDGDLETLIPNGYRDIDCYLYEAGMKLRYDKMDDLLLKGADPDVFISAYYPSYATDMLKQEGKSLYEMAATLVYDVINIDRLGDVWESGMKGVDYEIEDRLIYSRLFYGAAYMIVLNRLHEFEKSR